MAAAATSTIRGGHPYGIQPWGNYLTHGHIKVSGHMMLPPSFAAHHHTTHTIHI